MRGVLFAVVALLARPVPPDAASVLAMHAATREVPPASGRCRLQVGAASHDLRVWLDGDRMHLAVMGPLGAPRMVLLSDGVGVALPQGAETVSASEASEVLTQLGLPDLGELAGLWVGRLPSGRRRVASLPDGRGWAGIDLRHGELVLSAVMHRDRGVELVDVGPVDGDSILSFSRAADATDGLPDMVRLHVRDRPTAVASCQWTRGAAPEAAFTLDPGGQATSLEEVVRRLAPRLGMFSQRRHR